LYIRAAKQAETFKVKKEEAIKVIQQKMVKEMQHHLGIDSQSTLENIKSITTEPSAKVLP
jgi:hypothetical protein